MKMKISCGKLEAHRFHMIMMVAWIQSFTHKRKKRKITHAHLYCSYSMLTRVRYMKFQVITSSRNDNNN